MFTLYGDGPRPGVIVSGPGAPPDQGTWIPLTDLAAFLAERETQEAFASALPPTPIDFRAGGFSTPAMFVQLEPRRLRPSCTCGKDRDCTAPVCQCGDTSCECPLAEFNQHPR